MNKDNESEKLIEEIKSPEYQAMIKIHRCLQYLSNLEVSLRNQVIDEWKNGTLFNSSVSKEIQDHLNVLYEIKKDPTIYYYQKNKGINE
jgi:hypothetical protein